MNFQKRCNKLDRIIRKNIDKPIIHISKNIAIDLNLPVTYGVYEYNGKYFFIF